MKTNLDKSQDIRFVKMNILFDETVTEFNDFNHPPRLHLKYQSEYENIKERITLKFPWLQIFIRAMMLLQVMIYPFTLKLLFSNLSNPDTLIWCIPLFCFLGFFRVILRTQVIWLQFQLELSIRKALCKRIADSSIHSNIDEKQNVWNLINNQTNTAIGYFQSQQQLIFQTIKLFFGIIYLYFTFGTALFFGIGIVMLLVSSISFASRKIVRLNDELVNIRDKKFTIITFLLDRVRQIKMCRLENYFYEKIIGIRQQQFINLKHRKMWDSVCVAAWQFTHIVLSYTVFTIYLTWYSKDANFQIQSVLYILQMLIMPLNGLPWYLSGIMKAKQAMKRINLFFDSHPKTEFSNIVYNSQRPPYLQVTQQGNIPKLDLNIQKFKLYPGNVYCLQGEVSCGKSLFIKSLLSLVPSSYSSTINGKIGYVDQKLFHLQNSLSSIYSTFNSNSSMNTAQVRQLLLKFHCLQIPFQNATSTYSGGQKLRLALVRAFNQKDIIFIDSDLNSLDKKIKKYIQQQIITIAKQKNKLIIISSNNAISQHIIQISKSNIKLIQTQTSITQYNQKEHQQYVDSYYKNNNIDIRLFQSSSSQKTATEEKLKLKHFLFYYKNWKQHGIFLISIIFLYFFKNFYKYYMNEYINSEDFITNLTIITICYLGFVVIRSVYFAKANLKEAKRIGLKMIQTVGYGNIQFYEDSGKQSLTCRAMTDMETVDSQYAFEMNILFNNIFQMIFRIGVLLWSFYSMIIPVILFMIDFYRKFFRYRTVTKALEMSSHEISQRLLQSVNVLSEGKILIKGMKQQNLFLSQFNQRLDNYMNNKACIHVQDRQFAQRFHLATQLLMLLALILTYIFRDSISVSDIHIKLALSAMIGVTDYFGWLSKSIVTNERISYTLKRQSDCIQSVKHLNKNRMNNNIKKLILDNKGVKQLNIKDLDFKYEKSDQKILKNLNLFIKENEKIVIRGKTGSGKTTLFKVLTGLYPQYSEKSKYFQDVFISFSPQKPLILPGSLQQNLDPYKIFSHEFLQPYLSRFSSQSTQSLPSNQQLLINTTRAQIYGGTNVSIYDQPHKVASKGTLIIVSHHGDFQSNKQYQLLQGQLQ